MQLTKKKNRTDLMKAMASSSHKSNKFLKTVKSYFKSQDLFGKQVEFTFKGHRSYQTYIGAMVSILIKVILVIFILYEFYVIFSRKHPNVYTYYQLNSDPSINPFELGFDVAVSLTSKYNGSEYTEPFTGLDAQIATLNAYLVTKDTNSSSSTMDPLALVNCASNATDRKLSGLLARSKGLNAISN